MNNKIENDSMESKKENSTAVRHEKNSNSGMSWLWNVAGCLLKIMGFIIVMLITSGIRTCVRESTSSHNSNELQVEASFANTTESQIQSEISLIKAQLPKRVDNMTMIVDAKCTEKAVTYVYEIEDDDFDLRDVDKAEMKAGMLAEWGKHDSNQKLMARFCVETKRSVVFQYRSVNSGYNFSLIFTPSDLKSKI